MSVVDGRSREATPDAPVRLRPRALRLRVRRVDRAVFSVGGLFSLYEGIHKIQHPEELTNPLVPIVVLLIAIVLESFSLRTAVIESNQVRRGQIVGAVRPPRQGARAAGGAARGVGGTGRPGARPGRSRSGAVITGDSRLGRPRHASRSVPCSWSSPSSSASRPRACSSARGRCPLTSSAIRERSLDGTGDRAGHPPEDALPGPDELLVAAKIAVAATRPSRR